MRDGVTDIVASISSGDDVGNAVATLLALVLLGLHAGEAVLRGLPLA